MVLDSDDDSDNDDQQQQVVDEQQQEIQRLQGVADIICTDGKFADLGDLSPNRFEVVAGAGKKINITGRPGDGCLPYEQHQRPLEHETFVGIRLGEAIKPSFTFSRMRRPPAGSALTLCSFNCPVRGAMLSEIAITKRRLTTDR